MTTGSSTPDSGFTTPFTASGRWANRIAVTTSVYAFGNRVYKWVAKKRQDKLLYSITVTGADPLYDFLLEWLYGQTDPKNRRSAVARSTGKRRPSHDDVSPMEMEVIAKVPRIGLSFDSNRPQKVTIDGHVINVVVEASQYTATSEGMERYYASRNKITFSTFHPDGLSIIKTFLESAAVEMNSETRPPVVRIARKWGGWGDLSLLQPRELSTVVLAPGQRERLVNDLTQFLSRRERYLELGIPWHRGYLLSGPPGTGKTSAVKALAAHFKLPLYVMSLGGMESEATILEAIQYISDTPCILLLEDIDDQEAAQDRDSKEHNGLLSGLLNALDGVSTPDGLITFMTANNPNNLDAALLRPGRADLHEIIGYCGREQAIELIAVLTGHRLEPGRAMRRMVTPAEIVGKYQEVMDHPPVDAALAIWDFISVP